MHPVSYGMKWIIWLFAVLLVLAIGIVGFFWYQAYTAQGLVFDIEVPDHVQVGVPFDIEIRLANDSGAILQDARLSIALPDDMVFLGNFAGRGLAQEALGNLGEGSALNKSFQAMVISGESTLKKVEAVVSYLPSSLGSRFERIEVAEIRVSDSGVLIDLQSPAKVFSGEEFELEVRWENNSEIVFANLLIDMSFPVNFELISSTLDPVGSGSRFEIGNLDPGESGAFTVRGRLSGPDNSFFDIAGVASAEFFAQRYELGEQLASISISPSPLSLQLLVNGKDDYIARAGENLNYRLIYRNNTNVGLADVIVKASLSGEMFDYSSIDTGGGAFNSGTNVVTWNASQIPSLGTISPGQSGQINFSIKLKDEFPINRVSDRNFVLRIDANIESETVPVGVASNRTVGSDVIESRVAGILNFYGNSYFYDPESGIVNTGPHPPIVGQTTNYTIHWTLENTANDMENVQISAFLGPNVSFTGESWSSTGIAPSYNSRTQEMSWEIARIPATTGIISAPIRAIFQVELTPGIDQLNRTPILVRQSKLSAKDAFVDSVIEYTIREITTFISDLGAEGSVNVRAE